MALVDKLKQAVKGRSHMVEKGIDRAVGEVDRRTKGKYNDKLTQRAQDLKHRARSLDDERRDPPGGAPGSGSVPPPPI